MAAGFSIYLDLMRVLAALMVFVGHVPFAMGLHLFMDKLNTGIDAIVIFFVLSGYVISFAAEKLDKTWQVYLAARIARIYPVAITAVVLSIILSAICHNIEIGKRYFLHADELRHIPFTSMISLLFLNQSWWAEISAFDEGPYWTLPYEVWDYVLFGFAFFARGRWRMLGIAIVLLITGPKFWFLLPTWWAGAAAYKGRDKIQLSQPMAIAGFVIPVICYVFIKPHLPQQLAIDTVGNWTSRRLLFHHGLGGAGSFVWQWILAVMVAVHIYSARQMKCLDCLSAKPVATTIKWFAGFSFSLYLYHMSLSYFWRTMLNMDYSDYNPTRILALYAGTLSIVILLAQVTEHRKGKIRRWLLRRLGYLDGVHPHEV